MSGEFDELIRKSVNFYPDGNVAAAHLRREDEGEWDFIAVGRDNQPVMFWGPMDDPGESVVTNDEGEVLMTLGRTPPGVRPKGWFVVPASTYGSPIGSAVAQVTGHDEEVILGPVKRPPTVPAPDLGPKMVDALVTKHAMHTGGRLYFVERKAADGVMSTSLWTGTRCRCCSGSTYHPRTGRTAVFTPWPCRRRDSSALRWT